MTNGSNRKSRRPGGKHLSTPPDSMVRDKTLTGEQMTADHYAKHSKPSKGNGGVTVGSPDESHGTGSGSYAKEFC